MPPNDELHANAHEALRTREMVFVGIGVTGFWLLFSFFLESFYRDDNVGNTAPLLMEMTSQLLRGELPFHSHSFGGGGGAVLLPSTVGIFDPLVLLPALLLRGSPEAMMNIIVSLHFGLFAVGAIYLGRAISAPRWACIVGALSLGFCGYYFIWAGNWMPVLIPYTFLPWLVGGVVRLVEARDRRTLVVSLVVVCAAMLGLFLGGLMFAAYYGGIAAAVVVVARGVENTWQLRRVALRLAVPAGVFLVAVCPFLYRQMHLYELYGARENDPVHWVIFAVPLQAYVGLFVPTTYSVWRGPFFADGALISNIVMSCGVLPAWYILISVARRPTSLRSRSSLIVLAGVLLLVVVLSPGAFGLEGLFARIPVLNAVRWPFRGTPALQLVVLVLFFIVARSAPTRPRRFVRFVLYALCLGFSLVALSSDLARIPDPVPAHSWFRAAPMLADQETWSPSALAVLRRSGYAANVCRDEGILHAKPRLFFYGFMGAEYGVRTVHAYLVPPPRAYRRLGMSIKGCLSSWSGVRTLIENGPQRPLPGEQRWDDPRGPKDFEEIVSKTYVGAVVVDLRLDRPARYFVKSGRWRLLERRKDAALFVRRLDTSRDRQTQTGSR